MRSNKIKLEVLKEELKDCRSFCDYILPRVSMPGYMANGDVVRKYLERRVVALEQKTRTKKDREIIINDC
jgi:hypothetical protein